MGYTRGVHWNIDLVKQFVEVDSNSGCKLISNEYKNCKQKLKFQCKCGGFFVTTFDSFRYKDKRRCDKCGNQLRVATRKHTYEHVNNYLREIGFELIDTKYINNQTNMTLKDDNGYFYFTSFNQVKQNKKPSPFHINNPYTINNIKLWLTHNNKRYELISTEYKNNRTLMQWKCLNCQEIFESVWNNMLRGNTCSFCSGRRTGISNCLATVSPEIAKEWHPTKNDKLTPYDVTAHMAKKVWWLCSKNIKHEWKASINDRSNGTGCPYCAGKLPSEDYNLLVSNPMLCEEWNYIKNKKMPNQYTPFNSQKVWWVCKECNNEYQAPICDRNSKKLRGCPHCSQSKGEKIISEILKNYNIIYEYQKTYKNLVGAGGGRLSYDFYLPNFNLLIEYQGIQHEQPIDFNGKGKKIANQNFVTQQKNDQIKRTYAQNNNIKLLEIWYYDFDNIETILTDYLNECNKEEGDVAI